MQRIRIEAGMIATLSPAFLHSNHFEQLDF